MIDPLYEPIDLVERVQYLVECPVCAGQLEWGEFDIGELKSDRDGPPEFVEPTYFALILLPEQGCRCECWHLRSRRAC